MSSKPQASASVRRGIQFIDFDEMMHHSKAFQTNDLHQNQGRTVTAAVAKSSSSSSSRVTSIIEGSIGKIDENQNTQNTIKNGGGQDLYKLKSAAYHYSNAVEQDALDLPAELHNRLFDHQREGVNWLYNLHLSKTHDGGILGDDMGLGKTLQTVTLLTGLLRQRDIASVLIICPVSVLQSWVREITENLVPYVTGRLVVQLASSDMSKKKREKVLAEVWDRASPSTPRIVISSYQLVSNMISDFSGANHQHKPPTVGYRGASLNSSASTPASTSWDYVILDEGHIIKNPSTQMSQAMLRLPSHSRLILTGTPIQNNLGEFWTLVNWCTKGKLFGTKTDFKKRFMEPIVAGQDPNASTVVRELAMRATLCLKNLVNPIILQRNKSNVVKVGKLLAANANDLCQGPASSSDSNDSEHSTNEAVDYDSRHRIVSSVEEYSTLDSMVSAHKISLDLPTKIEYTVWVPLAESQRQQYSEYLSTREVSNALQRTHYPVEHINHLKTLCRHPFLAEAGNASRVRAAYFARLAEAEGGANSLLDFNEVRGDEDCSIKDGIMDLEQMMDNLTMAARTGNIREKDRIRKKTVIEDEDEDEEGNEKNVSTADAEELIGFISSQDSRYGGAMTRDTDADNYHNKLSPDATVFDIASRHPDVEELLADSVKLQVLLELVTRLRKKKHRLLIFSQSRMTMDIIAFVLDTYGHRTVRIDGKVTGRERQRIIDDFNRPVTASEDNEDEDDEHIDIVEREMGANQTPGGHGTTKRGGSGPIMQRHMNKRTVDSMFFKGVKSINQRRPARAHIALLTTKACGTGITLTGADRVILHDPSWNPAEDRQAVDRAYRIGQQRNVTVYRLIMASTVEEKMYEKQVFKDGLRVVVEQGKQSSSRYFSNQETKALFTLGPADHSVVLTKLWHCAGRKITSVPDDGNHGPVRGILGYSRHDKLYKEADYHVNALYATKARSPFPVSASASSVKSPIKIGLSSHRSPVQLKMPEISPSICTPTLTSLTSEDGGSGFLSVQKRNWTPLDYFNRYTREELLSQIEKDKEHGQHALSQNEIEVIQDFRSDGITIITEKEMDADAASAASCVEFVDQIAETEEDEEEEEEEEGEEEEGEEEEEEECESDDDDSTFVSPQKHTEQDRHSDNSDISNDQSYTSTTSSVTFTPDRTPASLLISQTPINNIMYNNFDFTLSPAADSAAEDEDEDKDKDKDKDEEEGIVVVQKVATESDAQFEDKSAQERDATNENEYCGKSPVQEITSVWISSPEGVESEHCIFREEEEEEEEDFFAALDRNIALNKANEAKAEQNNVDDDGDDDDDDNMDDLFNSLKIGAILNLSSNDQEQQQKQMKQQRSNYVATIVAPDNSNNASASKARYSDDGYNHDIGGYDNFIPGVDDVDIALDVCNTPSTPASAINTKSFSHSSYTHTPTIPKTQEQELQEMEEMLSQLSPLPTTHYVLSPAGREFLERLSQSQNQDQDQRDKREKDQKSAFNIVDAKLRQSHNLSDPPVPIVYVNGAYSLSLTGVEGTHKEKRGGVVLPCYKSAKHIADIEEMNRYNAVLLIAERERKNGTLATVSDTDIEAGINTKFETEAAALCEALDICDEDIRVHRRLAFLMNFI